MGCAASAAGPPDLKAVAVPLPRELARPQPGAPTQLQVRHVCEFDVDYTPLDLIGVGTFGRVHAVRKRASSVKLAAKFLEWQESQDIESAPKAYREARLWHRVSALESANVLQLKAFFSGPLCCIFVMERCRQTLFQHLTEAAVFTEAGIAGLLGQALAGLAHVHGFSVVHRDVKPGNFLVQDGVVKLIDFGLSGLLQPGELGLTGQVGTAPYMSPELLQNVPYDTSTDMWSFGAMAYVLLCGRFPFMPQPLTPERMKQAIRAGTPEPEFGSQADPLSSEASEFLRRALCREASSRPPAEELRGHAFTQEWCPRPVPGSEASILSRLQGACHYGAFT